MSTSKFHVGVWSCHDLACCYMLISHGPLCCRLASVKSGQADGCEMAHRSAAKCASTLTATSASPCWTWTLSCCRWGNRMVLLTEQILVQILCSHFSGLVAGLCYVPGSRLYHWCIDWKVSCKVPHSSRFAPPHLGHLFNLVFSFHVSMVYSVSTSASPTVVQTLLSPFLAFPIYNLISIPSFPLFIVLCSPLPSYAPVFSPWIFSPSSSLLLSAISVVHAFLTNTRNQHPNRFTVQNWLQFGSPATLGPPSFDSDTELTMVEGMLSMLVILLSTRVRLGKLNLWDGTCSFISRGTLRGNGGSYMIIMHGCPLDCSRHYQVLVHLQFAVTCSSRNWAYPSINWTSQTPIGEFLLICPELSVKKWLFQCLFRVEVAVCDLQPSTFQVSHLDQVFQSSIRLIQD